jgi:hypothetical protein
MDDAVRPPCRHTSHAARAIIRYRADQTGPNIQLGGVQEGLIKPAYHVGIEGLVKIEPINAAPKQIPIHTPRPITDRIRLIITPEAREIPFRSLGFSRITGIRPFAPATFKGVDLGISLIQEFPCQTGTGTFVRSSTIEHERLVFWVLMSPRFETFWVFPNRAFDFLFAPLPIPARSDI